VLIVETDAGFVSRFPHIVEELGYSSVTRTSFESARRELGRTDLVAAVANLRLGAFNGIHLAHIIRLTNVPARVLLYDRHHDDMLAREAQQAGAFYERGAFLPYSLRRFLAGALPEGDRRDVRVVDRRTSHRSGRRASDIPALHAAIT
jgi:DNA-binding NtrC family response regulator